MMTFLRIYDAMLAGLTSAVLFIILWELHCWWTQRKHEQKEE